MCGVKADGSFCRQCGNPLVQGGGSSKESNPDLELLQRYANEILGEQLADADPYHSKPRQLNLNRKIEIYTKQLNIWANRKMSACKICVMQVKSNGR